MGPPENEPDRISSEGPPHEVAIEKPFALSKFEVTFEEWDACVAAAACPRAPDGWGRGTMPAINVSWVDAKQYVGWLSQLTGKEYRLPTEAEWEYAARAGADTRYSWGDDVGMGNANCDECGSQWGLQTVPVGSFKRRPPSDAGSGADCRSRCLRRPVEGLEIAGRPRPHRASRPWTAARHPNRSWTCRGQARQSARPR